MALRFQPSFAVGELDEALQERINLERYSSALKTARNTIIGKTGRILTRPARKHRFQIERNEETKIHMMDQYGLFLTYGDTGWEIYTLECNKVAGETISWGVDAHYVNVPDIGVLVFKKDQNINYIYLTDPVNFSTFKEALDDQFSKYEPGFNEFETEPEVFTNWSTGDPDFFGITAGCTITSKTINGTGYPVRYGVTQIVNGVESFITTNASYNGNIPIATSAINYFQITASTDATEVRVYRAPEDASNLVGGAFGFIGSCTSNVGGVFRFTDFGQAADYTHTPPEYVPYFNEIYLDNPLAEVRGIQARTGIYYQQRLIMFIGNKMIASRTGKPLIFTRDFPYNDTSAISTNIGSNYSETFHVIESDGLIAFTSTGIYQHEGVMTPTNLAWVKKGNWVIDRNVPPLAVPGGVLFVDSSTNTVRHLTWSTEYAAYAGEEVSIFSDHLFRGKTVKSWAFFDGEFPLVDVVFSDGSKASFTYEREHQMRAWTRSDTTGIDCESVGASAPTTSAETGLPLNPIGFTIVKNDDGERFIEQTVRRYPTAQDLIDNPEADKDSTLFAGDSMASWYHLINDDLDDDDLTLTPVVADTWDGELTLACVDDAIFKSGTIGAVGTVFRYFDADGYSYDLEITARASDNSVTVQTDGTFPSTAATNPRLYECRNSFNASTKLTYHDLLTEHPSWVDDAFTIAPVVPATWDGLLTITGTDDNVFASLASASPGDARFYFQKDDGTYMVMVFATYSTDNQIIVQPSEEFPSASASNPPLYTHVKQHFSLDHLEGESVAAMGDGYVLASPLNDIEDYGTVTVTSGAATLPDSAKHAFVHFGRTYMKDVGTLKIDSVEQRPVFLESLTVNKLYIKVYESRGFYIANQFPLTETLTGVTDEATMTEVTMEDRSGLDVDYEAAAEVIANRYDQPVTKRVEVTIPGDWESQGEIAMRQPDPVHFEILSIAPDVEDLRRYDRRGE